MITHRLSTLTLADRVVVMETGKIIDVGTHADLLERCSLYSRLHQIHFKQSAYARNFWFRVPELLAGRQTPALEAASV